VVISGAEIVKQPLETGFHVIEALAPAVDAPTPMEVEVRVAGKSLGKQSLTVEPVRNGRYGCCITLMWTSLYARPDGSRTQTLAVLEQVIDLARRTADYPTGSAFKWNAEVLWAVDSFLRQASPQQQEALPTRQERLDRPGCLVWQ